MIQAHLIFWLIIVFSGLGCAPNDDDKNLSLETYEIKLKPDQLARFNSTIWSKIPVPARVKWQGEWYRVKIAHAGKSTIDAAKKSYDVFFERPIDEWQGMSIRLSSQFQDRSLLRSLIGFNIYEQSGIDSPKTKPITVTINGEYKGLYIAIETIDEHYYTARKQHVRSIYQARMGNANFSLESDTDIKTRFSIKTDRETYVDLIELMRTIKEENLEKLEKIMDLEQYVAYFSVSVFLNNIDGYNNNFYLANQIDTKQFVFIPWDLDRLFDQNSSSRFASSMVWGVPTELSKFVFSQDAYRTMHMNNLERLFAEWTDSEKLLRLVSEYQSILTPAYQLDPLLSFTTNLENESLDLKELIHRWQADLHTEIKKTSP